MINHLFQNKIPCMRMYFFVIIFVIWSSIGFSNNKMIINTPKNEIIDLASSSANKAIRKLLLTIRKLTPEEYIRQISDYRETFEKYAEHKKGVCSGEFNTLILNDTGSETDYKKSKLSRDEKKICYKELKATQINYINNMFQARKRYLNYMHNIRMQELKKIRQNAVDQIEKSLSSKR